MRKFSTNRDSGHRGERRERPQMHSAVCATCGKRCEVPFKPTGEKPIYCSFCFEKVDQGNKSSFKKPEKERGEITRADIAMLGDQLISINSKLEKLIVALTPEKKVVEPVKKESAPKKESDDKKKKVATPKTKTKEKVTPKKKETKKVAKKPAAKKK